jgi:hypothetical protein
VRPPLGADSKERKNEFKETMAFISTDFILLKKIKKVQQMTAIFFKLMLSVKGGHCG